MKWLTAGFLAIHLLILAPFADLQRLRPLESKVGYLPEAEVLKLATADQRYLFADWTIVKILFYFGKLIEKAAEGQTFAQTPDYPGMFRALQTALRLEPYNMDAYYFAQAAFTWEVGAYRPVNNLLEYGMRYRTWDYQLPFFAGFNAAYFLKDYQVAARYMQKAAELSGNEQLASLSSRYFYEAGQADLGVAYLDAMIKSARTPKERTLFQTRKEALLAIAALQKAVNRYRSEFGGLPGSLAEVVRRGFLAQLPIDPYGGKFYLDPRGQVRTTSSLALTAQKDLSD